MQQETMDFIIDSEFRSHIPQLRDDERKILEKSILEEGCRDPLIVWQEEGILLDGHNRYDICNKLGIYFSIEEISLPDRDAALAWIEDNQLGRRNLTPDQFRYYLGRKYERAKKQGFKGNQWTENAVRQNDGNHTAQKIAQEHGTSPRTVERAADYSKNLDTVSEMVGDNFKQDVLSGKEKVTTGELKNLAEDAKEAKSEGLSFSDEKEAEEWLKEKRKKKREEKEAKLNEEKQRIAEQVKESPNPPLVACESYESWLERQEPCDLILTDPPYSTDIDDVQSFAAHWLPMALSKVKPTGRAYIFIGAYPEEINAYLSIKMPTQILVWTYRNTLGPSPKKDYKLNWQAILYYRFDDSPDLDCPIMNEQFSVQDVSAPDGRHFNRYHEWQKPDEIAERIIRHSTKEKEYVIDPFCCTGTFILAASRLGRNGAGCDISTENLAIAQRRGCRMEEGSVLEQ
jgi:hypothetical protein